MIAIYCTIISSSRCFIGKYLKRVVSLTYDEYRLDTQQCWAQPRQAVLGRIYDALRDVRGVPQRRIRLLQGAQLHRHVAVLVVIALECVAAYPLSTDSHHLSIHIRPSFDSAYLPSYYSLKFGYATEKTGDNLMKAVYINKHGGPDELVYGDRPEPEIGPEGLCSGSTPAL